MESAILLFASRFAKEGYFVFPLYGTDQGLMKPYGWARNKPPEDVPDRKVIPATNDIQIVADWPRIVAEGYNGAEVKGYGVLGLNCVIFDLDLKDGKDGVTEFKKFQSVQKIPKPEFVVKSKSGGYHLYYDKPDKLKALAIKTVAGLSIGGTKYPGLDLRGDGGMVVGPMCEGPESEWKPGEYRIIKGGPESKFSEIPVNTVIGLSRAGMALEQEPVKTAQDPQDELETLRRGEIPPKLSMGNRNSGFFLYLNALRKKGFSPDTARKYVQELIKVTENPGDLANTVDVEDMISRVWRVDQNNPYDVCRDLIDFGMHRLTSYRNKLMYVILNENPYIDSRSPHDLAAVKQLMSKFTRKVVMRDGKPKTVNPADLIDSMIMSDREVATIGFKPGAPEVFTLTEAAGGKRYLNVWNDPRNHIVHKSHSIKPWDQFCFLVGRIFGPPGSDEYQLGLDFPAWILQHPGIKPIIAPFIMSRVRGVGKSLYFSVLNQIFGYSKIGDLQARSFKVDEITGRFFNPNGCSILLFDEVQFPVHRNMRSESTNFWKHLKSLVTSETVPVEFKGGDTVQMPNHAGIMMAGNTGNHFPIEEFDRRIWLIDNDPPELEEGVVDEFFMMSKNFMGRDQKREIINALLSHLSDHRIKLNLDKMRAPMTEIKREMYLNTLSDIEEWWITYFEDRENLMARTPVLNKSAIVYLISIAERLMNTKWREDPEGTFRELKRRGLLHPIRTQSNNYQTRNIRSVPIVLADGRVHQDGDGRDVLYTTRQHGEFNQEPNDVILQMLLANLNGLSKWRAETLKTRGQRLLGDKNG